MSFAPMERRKPLGLVLALFVYSLVVAVTPLLHHDFECHERTPGHCVACLATPMATGTAHVAPDAAPAFVDVGRVETRTPSVPESPAPHEGHGRSPPL
jgi:hypothetical protein